MVKNHRKYNSINKHISANYGAAANSNSGGSVFLPGGLLHCSVCKKNKHQDAFSKRQVLRVCDTKENKYAPGGFTSTPPNTTCRACTGMQQSELSCVTCNKTKNLGAFAKSHRKNPTQARCMKCVEISLYEEPGLSPANSDAEALVGSNVDSESESDFDADSDDDKKRIEKKEWIDGPAGVLVPVRRFPKNNTVGWNAGPAALSASAAAAAAASEDGRRSADGGQLYDNRKGWAKIKATEPASDPNNKEWHIYARSIQTRRGEKLPPVRSGAKHNFANDFDDDEDEDDYVEM